MSHIRPFILSSKTILSLLKTIEKCALCFPCCGSTCSPGNWICVIPGIGLQRNENVFHLGKSLFGCCINITLRKSTRTNITIIPTINELLVKLISLSCASSSEYYFTGDDHQVDIFSFSVQTNDQADRQSPNTTK